MDYLKVIPEYTIAFPVANMPQINLGDKIGSLVVDRMSQLSGVMDKDIYVIASKIVSKAEGRYVDLTTIKPSQEAHRIYGIIKKKSPALFQVILNESLSYKVNKFSVLSQHRLGYVLTSAGVDSIDDTTAIVLPQDPDQSAQHIASEVEKESGKKVAVIISDSEGRTDRRGANAVAVGIAGINPVRISSSVDLSGSVKVNEETICDMLAGQAALLMGQRGRNIPVVCIRGYQFDFDYKARATDMIHKDLLGIKMFNNG